MTQQQIFHHLLIAAIIIVVAAVAGRLLRWLIDVISRRLAARTDKPVDIRIVRAVESRIVPLAIVVGCALAIRELRKVPLPEDITSHEILDYLAIGAFIVFIILASSLIGRFLKTSVVWYVERVSAKNRTNLAPAVVPFVSKLINIVIFFIVGMIVLDHLGVNIGGFLVSLGVGSLAIALAAQETIANMIAWFVILVDQPIRLGDRIRLPSGEEGLVSEIGLRSTKIINPDNNLVVIPNGELVKNRLINLSAPDIGSRLVIDIPVAYGTDIDRVRKIALALLAKKPGILTTPAPDLFVLSFDDFAITTRLQARIDDILTKFPLETSLREELYTALRLEGIEFPRAQRLVPIPERYAAQTPEKK